MNTHNGSSSGRFDPRQVFAALRHRNYRLFFSGQGVSLIGTWMQRVAVQWLVYRMTGSVFMLGLVGFLGQIPTFVIAPFAGVVADRYERRKLLVMIQSLAMVQALVLSALVLTHVVRIWHIVILSFVLGLINSFDIPIRQSFTIEMVEDGGGKDLGKAIAMNSSMVNTAKLVGPSVAGVLIGLVGEGLCFLLNAASYLAVIASLLAMKIKPRKFTGRGKDVWHDLREGFEYSLRFGPIKYILFILATISLMGHPYMVLMPVFAKKVLHGGPHTLGFLMGSAGSGALIGALYLAARDTVRGLIRRIWTASLLFGIAIIGFSFSTVLWLSMFLLMLAGFGMIVQMAASNTVLQTIVDDNMRGRVMSFYTMAMMGMTPFGSLFAGVVADKIGAPWTLMVGGVCCMGAALFFMHKIPVIREKIRPIYIEKGIIPAVS
jgi:MFS family permease